MVTSKVNDIVVWS